ncbi:unnamed protein product [marine sediment metagenome]|uniref:Uncharacterized protein n=1 Tax=marine sediment metagenome TaxID=412755 RepID=X0SSW1_9ZZZZ
MAKISGAAGGASLAAGEILITSWTCDVSGETIDTTDSGDTTWMTHMASGYKGWSGSFEGFAITTVEDETVGDTPAELILTTEANNTYTGNAIITGVSTVVDVPGAEAVKKSYTFQGTGALVQAVS